MIYKSKSSDNISYWDILRNDFQESEMALEKEKKKIKELNKIASLQEDLLFALSDDDSEKVQLLQEELSIIENFWVEEQEVERLLLLDNWQHESQRGTVQHLVLVKKTADWKNRLSDWYKQV